MSDKFIKTALANTMAMSLMYFRMTGMMLMYQYRIAQQMSQMMQQAGVPGIPDISGPVTMSSSTDTPAPTIIPDSMDVGSVTAPADYASNVEVTQTPTAEAVSGADVESAIEAVDNASAEAPAPEVIPQLMPSDTAPESDFEPGMSVTAGAMPPDSPPAESAAKDDLTQIKGIGKTYAKRLNAAGVTTFAALAQLSPERLTDIVTAGQTNRSVDTDEWLAKARELAGQ